MMDLQKARPQPYPQTGQRRHRRLPDRLGYPTKMIAKTGGRLHSRQYERFVGFHLRRTWDQQGQLAGVCQAAPSA